MWATVDKAGARRLLGDARVLVLPAVEFLSCTALHEVFGTVSYECLCARCIAIEPNGTAFLTSLACAQQAGPEKTSFEFIPRKSSLCRLDTCCLCCSLVFLRVSCWWPSMFEEDSAERTMKSKKNLGDCVVVHRKSSRRIVETVRERKLRSNGEPADHVENSQVPIDETFISRYGECFLRDARWQGCCVHSTEFQTKVQLVSQS